MTAWRTSACTRRSRRVSTGSASCCRWASSPRTRCARSQSSARDLGDGDIRLTVWQNLLSSGVPDAKVRRRSRAIARHGPCRRSDLHPRRASSPAPAVRLQVRGCQHQGHRRRADREHIESKPLARPAGEHSSHGLPPFLRPALHRRHRPDRRQGTAQRRGRYGRKASTSWSAAARATMPRSPASCGATSRRGLRRRPSRSCSAPTSLTAPIRPKTFFAFANRHDIDTLKRLAEGSRA